MYGISTPSNGRSGVIAEIPRLGLRGLCFRDAGNGVWYTDFVNNYLNVDPNGGAFRKKGIQVALGPAIGPLGRITTGGRSQEVPSDEPYLSNVMGRARVEGMQAQGHFIAHEQELYSKVVDGAGNYTIEAVSSYIDDKTMQELYLWTFQDALKVGAGNIM
ncbi:hypothetical protein AARAC_001870 [Aspergillus arachidicola]|uniref:beta-glucosidase n=1 Tax=Aspergillus arachidicola TaxID=656916 RepID=A0A2G7FTK6_9EURO|nr:hypothetical protein AARAC_001870 [Aspergillus arachidicola]